MKDTIILTTMLALIAGVIMTGIWYVNQQNTNYAYEQTSNIVDKNQKPTTRQDTETDPFGLFGANEVVYEVTFATDWSDETHVDMYPSTAHMSPPVLWIGKDNPVFSIGTQASPGMKEMAEEGRTREIKKELEELVENGGIKEFHIYDRIDAPGKDTYQITVSRDAPVVSIVSMIAPSPDWFVTVEGVNLLEDNRWKNQVELSTIALDAGTEEGGGFGINNPATSPVGTIAALTDIPSAKLRPFAYVQLKRIGYEGN